MNERALYVFLDEAGNFDCSWAIYRKWDGQDERSYQLIRAAISSELDFCRTGTTTYY